MNLALTVSFTPRGSEQTARGATQFCYFAYIHQLRSIQAAILAVEYQSLSDSFTTGSDLGYFGSKLSSEPRPINPSVGFFMHSFFHISVSEACGI